MTGWALAPGGRSEDVTFQLNGLEFEHIEYPKPSDYLSQSFAYRDDARLAAFTCSSRVTRATAYPPGLRDAQLPRGLGAGAMRISLPGRS